ncbi:MAG: hydantoinase B/oxoprolinase family protein [Anaerovoracaceae bacterium]
MKKKLDPITFEVVRSSFDYITKMMSQTLQKISFSPIMYDQVDFSNALFDDKANLIGQTTNVPVHLAAMHHCVNAAVDAFKDDFNEGDVVILNDPYRGGTHNMDVTFVTPVFWDGKLIAYACSRGHWQDMGEKAASSESPTAVHIAEEGLRLPPTKIYIAGEPVTWLIDIIRNNTRAPYFIDGDIRAHMGALNTAKKHFFELVEKYGEDTVRACMEEALDYTERRTRAAIKKLPNGVYTADDYIDADGVNNKAIFVKATVTIEDEDITVDLTGSSATVDGPVNYPLAGTCSGVYFGLKFFLDPDAPPNAGMYRPIHIIVPENTVFNPRWPAPVYYGNLITSEKVADLIWQCLEQAIPEQIVGMPYADCNPISWGVVNAREGVSDTFGELPPGGWGGTPFGDGMSATYSRHGNCMDFTPEQMELLYPVICTEREFKEDSAGAGKYRGGLALQVSWKLLQNSTMNVGMGRSRFGPPGVCGGKDGKPSSVILNMGTDREEVIGGYTKDHEYLMTMFDNYPMKAGDTVTMITQGGGGYGDPKERDPELVKKDVRNGLVSKEAALEEYGVKL